MKHLTLDEWDSQVAPILGAITIRTNWIRRDIEQVSGWVNALPCVPEFESEAEDKLRKIQAELQALSIILEQAVLAYQAKEKVS